jgi:hypothetical protein
MTNQDIEDLKLIIRAGIVPPAHFGGGYLSRLGAKAANILRRHGIETRFNGLTVSFYADRC